MGFSDLQNALGHVLGTMIDDINPVLNQDPAFRATRQAGRSVSEINKGAQSLVPIIESTPELNMLNDQMMVFGNSRYFASAQACERNLAGWSATPIS